MNRITHDCQQGSNEWLQLRAKYFTASELSAAAGQSKYQSRTDLIKQKATGIVPEVDAAKQRLFDAGHAAEAAARPIVEARLGAELYPVTMSCEVDGLPLLASLDGIDMLGDVIWENKLLNASLKADIQQGKIEPHYAYQIEQQLLVSGAEKCYFTASDGTEEGTFGMWYESNPELRQEIVSIWTQFAKDVAAYVPTESKPAAVAEVIEDLPALTVQLVGNVTASNLPAFQAAVLARIKAINTNLVTDNDFATADKMVKFLDDGEKRLDLVKSQALAQTSSIDELFRTIDSLKAEMRSKRLTLDKLVKAEKETRKAELVRDFSKQIAEHVLALQERVGVQFKPAVVSFADEIKGLKSLDSMRDKLSVALANAKIEANAIADRIEANRKTVEDMSLFPDFIQVCTKAPEDFAALLAMRVAQRKEVEEKRLQSERERIRVEEQIKAEREVQAKVEAEIAERNRIAAEEIRRLDAERKAAALAEAEKLAAEAKVAPAMQAVNDAITREFSQTYPNGAPVFDQSNIKENGDPVMLDPDGKRSIFCDVDEGDEKPTGTMIKLGEICTRLGYTVSADFLASLGFEATTEKNARLYPASQWPTICRKIADHTMALAFKKAA